MTTDGPRVEMRSPSISIELSRAPAPRTETWYGGVVTERLRMGKAVRPHR